MYIWGVSPKWYRYQFHFIDFTFPISHSWLVGFNNVGLLSGAEHPNNYVIHWNQCWWNTPPGIPISRHNDNIKYWRGIWWRHSVSFDSSRWKFEPVFLFLVRNGNFTKAKDSKGTKVIFVYMLILYCKTSVLSVYLVKNY